MVAGRSSSAAAVVADRGRNLSAGSAILTQQKPPQTKLTHTDTQDSDTLQDSVASSAYPSQEQEASRGGQEASVGS